MFQKPDMCIIAHTDKTISYILVQSDVVDSQTQKATAEYAHGFSHAQYDLYNFALPNIPNT